MSKCDSPKLYDPELNSTLIIRKNANPQCFMKITHQEIQFLLLCPSKHPILPFPNIWFFLAWITHLYNRRPNSASCFFSSLQPSYLNFLYIAVASIPLFQYPFIAKVSLDKIYLYLETDVFSARDFERRIGMCWE